MHNSATTPDSSGPDDNLDWLAFRYIADELSATERTAFEALLENDQLAREAVAHAVQLALATQHVFADDAVRLAQRQAVTAPAGYRGWYSVALACGGLLALVVMNNLVWQVGQPANEDRQLAIAWSEARDAFATSAVVAEEQPDTAEHDGDVQVLVDEESVALPTWMLAAVSESNTNMSEEGSGDAISE